MTRFDKKIMNIVAQEMKELRTQQEYYATIQSLLNAAFNMVKYLKEEAEKGESKIVHN